MEMFKAGVFFGLGALTAALIMNLILWTVNNIRDKY